MMKGGLGNFMKQAQQMQEKMQKMQEELANAEVTGQSGAGSAAGIKSSRCAPIAFDTRLSSTIETLPLPLSSCAM